MVTVPGIVAAIAATMLTVLVGAIDRRILVMLLTALVVFSNMVAFFAPSFAVMLVGRVLLGLCVGGFWTLSAAIGRGLVPEEAGGRATALIIAAISVATDRWQFARCGRASRTWCSSSDLAVATVDAVDWTPGLRHRNW